MAKDLNDNWSVVKHFDDNSIASHEKWFCLLKKKG